MSRKRDFTLTGNYASDTIKEELIGRLEKSVTDCVATYACYGEEVAPTTGQKHLQAYIRFKDGKTLSSCTKLMKGFHCIMSKGDCDQNIKYCAKTREGDIPNEVFCEYGTRAAAQGADGGNRTKELWLEYKAAAKEGRIDDIDGEIFIKHYSSLKRIERDFMIPPPDMDGVCGIWYYGDTGTGKSRAARLDYPNAFMKLPNKWWDGYTGQDNVIIDDFDKNHSVLGYHLKIWGDRYAFTAEVKGTTTSIRPKKIVVTSNYHPKEIWGESPQTLEPILRRFHVTKFQNFAQVLDVSNEATRVNFRPPYDRGLMVPETPPHDDIGELFGLT